MNRSAKTTTLGLMIVGTAATALASAGFTPTRDVLPGARGPAPEAVLTATSQDPGSLPDSGQRARALHLLNRITFGPRPGDVDRVLAIGVERFLDEQLDPDVISDDRLAGRLPRFRILHLSSAELAELAREMRQQRLARQRAEPPVSAADSQAPDETGPTIPQPNELRSLLGEFQQLAVVRATLSERQLYEVMVDFWTNHFNVYLAKGAGRYLTPEYIERTIRPNALGRFGDLLAAVAKSPAMLFYLDNVESVAEGSEPPRLTELQRALARHRARIDSGRQRERTRSGRTPTAARVRDMEERLERLRERLPSGLNENYARELLELHTLGVDAGYTQRDVVEVARIFTGWSIDRPARGGTDFVFNEWAHDRQSKKALGVDFPAGGGVDEGLRLLEILASHPATQRHVGGKLCARFVRDAPPADCIDVAAAAWERTDGDIREVVRAVLTSDAFWAPQNTRAKTKTPFEFIVSAVRALGAEPEYRPGLARLIGSLGQPLYLHEPPSGYPEIQEEWVNAGALLNRLNAAIALASTRHPGVVVQLDRITPVLDDPEPMIAAVNDKILNGMAENPTLQVMRAQAESVSDPFAARSLLVGLALGSPEFQRQ